MNRKTFLKSLPALFAGLVAAPQLAASTKNTHMNADLVDGYQRSVNLKDCENDMVLDGYIKTTNYDGEEKYIPLYRSRSVDTRNGKPVYEYGEKEHITIYTNGNVGIGNTAPSYKIHATDITGSNNSKFAEFLFEIAENKK
jgi:hypothetical protein